MVEKSVNSRLWGVVFTAALGGFLFGFDSSIINGTVEAIRAEFGLTSGILGVVVSIALIGAGVGAWTAGMLADRIGRVRTMIVAAAIFIISSAGAGLAFGVIDLIIWRFIGGVAIGFASVVAPGYIAEVSPAKHRGVLGSMQQMAIVIGIFSSLLASALFVRASGGASEDLWFGVAAWRWMLMSGIIPAVIYGLCALRIPESPRYLVGIGKVDEARDVIRTVLGVSDDSVVDEMIESIAQTVSFEKKQTLTDLRGAHGRLLPVVWVGIILAIFQQAVGINVIFYYSTTLWQAVGFQESDSFTISVITAITNVVATIIAIALIDRVGRRPLLIGGSVTMTITLGVMAAAFAQSVMEGDELVLPGVWGMIALVAANLFVVGFGVTWGPALWVLLGEMFPNRIRAYALGVGGATQWIANFIISATFPSLADLGLQYAYGIYAIFALASLGFAMKFVPETKGRTLEEMTDDATVR